MAIPGCVMEIIFTPGPRFSCLVLGIQYMSYRLGSVAVRGTYVGIEFALRVHQNLVNSSRSAELRSNNKAHASLSNNHRDYIFIKDRPSIKIYRRVSTSLLNRLCKYPLKRLRKHKRSLIIVQEGYCSPNIINFFFSVIESKIPFCSVRLCIARLQNAIILSSLCKG